MPTLARLSLLVACLLWAASFVATKIALEAAPPLTVVTLRLLISAACFILWLALKGGIRVRPTSSLLGRLAGLSLLGTGLHYGLQTVGLQFTTAANASLWAVTAPITIALLGVLVLGERLTLPKVTGIALACIGVVVVIGRAHVASFDWRAGPVGDLLVLLSIAMWGLFTVYGKALTDELGALATTAGVTIIGALWTLPAGIAETLLTGFDPATITLRAWLALAFLGVGCSFVATLLYFVALGLSQAQKVGVYLYLIPPMTAVIAAAVLSEPLTLRLAAGAALVLAGVALTERG